MKPEVLTLNINSDVFDPMKTDFNSVLKNTLRNMYSKQSDVAEITLKLKITLEEDTAPDIDSGRVTGTREIVKPLLSHKLSSVMQIKEEKSGSFNGNYELVYDEDAKEFVIRPIEDAQMTFGDEFDMPCDGEIIDADFEDCDEDCDNEQPQIEGREDLPMLGSGDDTDGEDFVESLPDDFFDDDNDIPERIGDFEELAE